MFTMALSMLMCRLKLLAISELRYVRVAQVIQVQVAKLAYKQRVSLLRHCSELAAV